MELLDKWLAESDDNQRVFQQEELIVDVSEEVWQAMIERDVNKSKLADLLGVSKSRVTRLLDGTVNMTLRTLSDVSRVLNRKVSIRLEERKVVAWKTEEIFCNVIEFTPHSIGSRTGKVTMPRQWNTVNDHGYVDAHESIAA